MQYNKEYTLLMRTITKTHVFLRSLMRDSTRDSRVRKGEGASWKHQGLSNSRFNYTINNFDISMVKQWYECMFHTFLHHHVGGACSEEVKVRKAECWVTKGRLGRSWTHLIKNTLSLITTTPYIHHTKARNGTPFYLTIIFSFVLIMCINYH